MLTRTAGRVIGGADVLGLSIGSLYGILNGLTFSDLTFWPARTGATSGRPSSTSAFALAESSWHDFLPVGLG